MNDFDPTTAKVPDDYSVIAVLSVPVSHCDDIAKTICKLIRKAVYCNQSIIFSPAPEGLVVSLGYPYPSDKTVRDIERKIPR